MLLIADAGSTKIDWRIVDGKKELYQVQTRGFNPFLHGQEILSHILVTTPPFMEIKDQITAIKYFGSGCSSDKKEIVVSELNTFFRSATSLSVDSDMLGAAFATCGNKPGITCILGTGSNSCLFDGEKIIDQVPNLGFVLGDEGGGIWIGKMLLRKFFYRELSPLLEEEIIKKIPGGRTEALTRLFELDKANAFLSSFANIAVTYKDLPEIVELVTHSFSEFVQRHVLKYQDCRSLPVHFIGSVANSFSDILHRVLNDSGLNPGFILQKPIGALVDYCIENQR